MNWCFDKQTWLVTTKTLKRRPLLNGHGGRKMKSQRLLLFLLAATFSAATMTGCGTTSTVTTTSETTNNVAQQRREIDTNVSASLTRLYNNTPGSRELVSKAKGVLVFPSVIAAGLGVGGEYGQGALRINNATTDYYSLGSVSVGLQIGAQSKAIYFLFMTQEALDKFRASQGWSVGADASVAVLRAGANGAIDINTVQGPVVAFVLTNAGLMANLTLEGTKITRLK
jgi:lipid-binding SYLF domain-containing protein